MLVEQATVHVHKDPWHLTTLGLGVGYRYHFHEGSSPFVGALAGGKLGFGRLGDGEGNGLMARALFATAHAGWRWIFGRGFTVTARVGAGYARYMLEGDAAEAAEPMMDDRLRPLPFELDSELSVGLSF